MGLPAMKGEQFRLWVKACEEFGTEIWPLETHGDDGLYLTRKPYMAQHREYCTSPAYQIWIGDKRQVTMARDEAYAIWRAHMEQIEKDQPKIVQFISIREIREIPRDWDPKPCPFCGSLEAPHFFGYLLGTRGPMDGRWGVVCLDCMATMNKGWCQNPRAALDEWNNRPAEEEAEFMEMLK